MSTTLSLAQVKLAVAGNLGTPKTNQNAATTLAGTRFTAGNGKVEVQGTILETLSDKNKVRAELTCSHPGCTETHVREMSDWHQSVRCRTHANVAVKLTQEEKDARKLARAQAIVAALSKAA